MIKKKLQKKEEIRGNKEKQNQPIENSDGNTKSFIDIKPFVNFTLNAFGVFDDINEDEPFDPNDSRRIFHSMFQIWNPKVGPQMTTFNQTQF